MNNLEFLIFYLLIFLSGRGLLILYVLLSKKNIMKLEKVKLLNTEISIFYTTISLLFFGNLILLVNFISSINQAKNFIFILFAMTVILNVKHRFYINDKFRFTFSNLIIPLVLSFSIYGNWLHADAGYYHLPHQLWIRNEKIIFGLGKLDIFFSTSSMYEYLSSILWINNSFNLLHYLNLVFFVLLFSFITFHLTSKNLNFLFFSSFAILIYSLLDNIGLYGGSNGFIKIQTLGKPDVAVGVLIYIISVTLIQHLLDKNFNYSDLIFSLTLITFTFQIRIFGAILFLIWIIYFFIFLKSANYSIGSIIFGFLPNIFIFLLWSAKNLINSACFIFPIKQTCINSLQWSNLSELEDWSTTWKDWSYSYRFNENFFDWALAWFNTGTNYQEAPNYLISFVFIYLINKFLFRQDKYKTDSKLIIKFYFGIGLIFFLMFGFHIRYMFGFVLLSIAMQTLNNKDFNPKTRRFYNFKITYLMIFISIFMIPRGYSYKYFIENPFNYYSVEVVEEVYLVKNKGWGSYSNTGKCFNEPECTRNENHLKLNDFYYKYLIFEN
ncbi:MAG: hypothetical protein CL869_00465 [Cytophagia bacterium]|nr:hypothetical protein [Cytophagia bacterium]|tara:strand:+ start:3186 stop:4841 length:1656 start_codon:yes stop_codon:yes gene_type:complete